jgi:large subunit ribosomal protein L13
MPSDTKGDITKTYREAQEAKRWFLIDAKGKVVGRIATRIARILRGKHRARFTPNEDMGDGVIVINAAEAVFTGGKAEQKTYFRHSTNPGHAKFTSVPAMLEKHPERIIESAVAGMLPKTALGRRLRTKLKIYKDGTHFHAAQKPVAVEL